MSTPIAQLRRRLGHRIENGNACIDKIGNTYLLTGKLPVADGTCKAVPPPTP